MFFWSLAERDAREGRDCSRVFVRMVTNILLHLAAVDDDVSYAGIPLVYERLHVP